MAIPCNVKFPAGYTLTVSEGAHLSFVPGTRLTINSNLQAIGTSSNKITFTRSGSSGHWDGIYIHDSNMSPDLIHCIIEHADYGVYVRNTIGYVLIKNSVLQYNTYGLASEYSSPYKIYGCDIINNEYGIWIDSRAGTNNNVRIKSSWIEDNSNHGVYIQNGINPDFGECHLRDNGGHGLYCIADVSPYLYESDGDNYIRDNGMCGVRADNNAYPKLGYSQNYGYNHIYGNDDHHIYNNNDMMIAAVRNYWSYSTSECVIPSSYKFYGWVEYCPILPEGCPDCQSKHLDDANEILTDSNDRKIPLGYELELNELFEDAIQAYTKDIENNPQGQACRLCRPRYCALS